MKGALKMRIRVWLDDVRPMPEHFDVHVRTAEEAIALIRTGEVQAISLDNDLGYLETEGYEVATFIEENAQKDWLPRMDVYIHTGNPAAKLRMVAAIENARRYWGER